MVRRQRFAKVKKEFELTIHPKVQEILKQIGTPEERLFKPDPFQLEAIKLVRDYDVLVTAPTGAGKTYIAIEAIKRILEEGKRAWYASPLKALSNSKYTEFKEIFGSSKVGILTGDRKENPDAPVIVGTTEILRNQLYDTMHQGLDLNIDLVVMDEAHYLGDEDRGVVWEEVLIYLPLRVRLLLLSATIKNAKEICSWLTWLRNSPCKWVSAKKRPVPLYSLFLFPTGELVPLETEKGFYEKIDLIEPKDFPRTYFPDIPNIMEALRKANLLPAIFFLKSRADCEKAISMCLPVNETSLSKDKSEFLKELNRLIKEYPFLENHKHMKILKECRVGAHHGGQLPQWKMLLEKLMQESYLEAIFSTSTVAAGVNFPARTVVIAQSDRFNGHEFVALTSTELHQMTGRAGRRGMDKVGFVLVIPGPYQYPRYIYQLLHSPPEPVESKVKVNFSMVLNLLLSHKLEDIKELFSLSLATYQTERKKAPKAKALLKKLKKEMAPWQDAMACGEGIEFIETRRRYLHLTEQISQLKSRKRREVFPEMFHHLLVRGRIVYTKQQGTYIVVERPRIDDRHVKAVKLKIPLKTRKGAVKISLIKFSSISFISHHIENLPAVNDIERWEEVANRILSETPISRNSMPNPLEAEELEISKLLEIRAKMPCSRCELFGACIKGTSHPFTRIVYKCEMLSRKIITVKEQLWRSFLQHYHFLVQEGYVDEKGKPTDDGLWASKLRLDQPLLISECIKQKLLPEDDPPLLAALISPFVIDRDRGHDIEVTTLAYKYPELYGHYFMMLRGIYNLKIKLQSAGFPVPSLPFWPVVVLYLWAKESPWEEIRELFGVDEGDLVMLIVRTADHLSQIESLSKTHLALAESARKAREIIMREPVI